MSTKAIATQFGSAGHQAPKAVPFVLLAAPWLLQGILLICATHGHPPMMGSAGGDVYSSTGGPINGTTLYLIGIGIWVMTLFILVPIKRSSIPRSFDNLVLLAFPILAIGSTVWSTAPKNTIAISIALLMVTAAGIYIGTAFTPAQQMQLLMITGVVAAVSSLLIAGLDPKDGLDPYGHVGALKGIFTHKNGCGFFMALLCTPAFFIRRTMRISRLAIWGYLFLCGGTVILSQSRTAWIDLLFIPLATVALALFRRFVWRDGIVVIALVGVVVAIAIAAIVMNMDLMLGLLGKDSSFSGRTLVWQAVFSAIMKRKFLGYGYAAFFSSLDSGAGSLVMTTGFVVNHPHNGYLSIWLDLGLAGLSLLFVTIGRAGANARKAWRRSPHVDWYICIIVLILIENCSEIGLATSDDLSWLMFVVACAGLHQTARSRQVGSFEEVGLEATAGAGLR